MGVDMQAPSSGVSLRAKRAGPENVSQPRDVLIVASTRSRSKRPRGASQGQSGRGRCGHSGPSERKFVLTAITTTLSGTGMQ